MVLRARFFLMAWRAHIEAHPDYTVHDQFISRESFDIFMILCDSLLKLIISYRNYFPTYPLLPWLHSTEICEHVFGVLRQLKKDFNYVDFLYLERKLRIILQGAFRLKSDQEQANQTAAGYHHTHFDAADYDGKALRTWPSDEDLGQASQLALEDVQQLMSILGIDAKGMLLIYEPPQPPILSNPVPPIIPKGPATLLELLTLFHASTSTTQRVQECVEQLELAIAADDTSKSLMM
jgi:hypothetical protein